MKVSRYYSSNTSITQSSQLRSTESSKSSASSSVLPQEDASPAVNSINHDVFNALNEFMYLNGQDRTDSYKSLNNKDKDKFLSVLNQLVEKGTVKKEALSVDGSKEPEIIKNALSERNLKSPKSYDQSGSSSILE